MGSKFDTTIKGLKGTILKYKPILMIEILHANTDNIKYIINYLQQLDYQFIRIDIDNYLFFTNQ